MREFQMTEEREALEGALRCLIVAKENLLEYGGFSEAANKAWAEMRVAQTTLESALKEAK